MNKLMSSAARAVLAQYADAKEVYVTEDGQAFLNANYATNHAAQSGMPEPVRVERDRSDVVMSAEDNAKLEGERIAKEKAAQAKADTEAVKAKEEAEAKAKADTEAAKAKEEAEAKAKAEAAKAEADKAPAKTSKKKK